MTKHDLKELAAIGAELGAAKAENEKLRGLLTTLRISLNLDDTEYGLSKQEKSSLAADIDAELSRQAKPTDTYTAVDMATAAAQGFRDGQAAVEPAPAQDERENPVVVATAILGGLFHGGSGPELGEIDIEVCTPALETIQCETVNSSDDVFLPLMTVAQHERIVTSLTRPAQTEQKPVAWLHSRSGAVATEATKRAMEDGSVPSGYDIPLYAAPIAQTAPQPEQSGLADLVRIALHNGQLVPDPEMSGSTEVFGIKLDDMEALEATLSAQGQSNGDS